MKRVVWLLLVVACKRDAADRAADHALDRQSALRDVKNRSDDKTSDVVAANAEFHEQRARRIAALSERHAAIAAQPGLIASLSRSLPLDDATRADLTEKLHALEVQLDQTANLIAALSQTEPALWKQRDEVVTGAMKRLEDARAAAWRALEGSHERSS